MILAPYSNTRSSQYIIDSEAHCVWEKTSFFVSVCSIESGNSCAVVVFTPSFCSFNVDFKTQKARERVLKGRSVYEMEIALFMVRCSIHKKGEIAVDMVIFSLYVSTTCESWPLCVHDCMYLRIFFILFSKNLEAWKKKYITTKAWQEREREKKPLKEKPIFNMSWSHAICVQYVILKNCLRFRSETSSSLKTCNLDETEAKSRMHQPQLQDLPVSPDKNGMDQGQSDVEDDPGKLLNAWLGELDSLKKVNRILFCQVQIFFKISQHWLVFWTKLLIHISWLIYPAFRKTLHFVNRSRIARVIFKNLKFHFYFFFAIRTDWFIFFFLFLGIGFTFTYQQNGRFVVRGMLSSCSHTKRGQRCRRFGTSPARASTEK